MAISPAVEVARKNSHNVDLNEPITLSTGYNVRLKPVPAMLIEEAQSRIKDPKIPKQKVEGKDYPVENPADPEYLEAVKDTYRQRAQAGIDVMVLFGIELVDGIPESKDWLNNLKFLSKRGILDLEGYDFDDPLECEFIFKKFICMGNEDWILLSKISGVSEEDIAQAKETFQSSA